MLQALVATASLDHKPTAGFSFRSKSSKYDIPVDARLCVASDPGAYDRTKIQEHCGDARGQTFGSTAGVIAIAIEMIAPAIDIRVQGSSQRTIVNCIRCQCLRIM